MRKLQSLVLLIVLAMAGIAGCSKTRITDLPPNVSEKEVQAWYAATGAVKIIAETTKGLTDGIIDINTSDPKLIQPDDYQKVLLALGQAAQAGIHVDSILRQAPDSFGKGTKEQILAEIRPIIEQFRQADLEGIFSRSQSPRLQTELTLVKSFTEAAHLLLSLAQ